LGGVAGGDQKEERGGGQIPCDYDGMYAVAGPR